MTDEHLQRIRERADSVLDGFAKNREQLAHDAKDLCDEVSRLHRSFLAMKLKMVAAERSGLGSGARLSELFNDDFWKSVLGGKL